MTLEFEVEALVKKGKLGSAINLIAQSIEELKACKINKKLTKIDRSLAVCHHRLDKAYKHLNELENKLEELLK